jgi:DeoR/GlpR family transcriptional regulator of sugar metabolism
VNERQNRASKRERHERILRDLKLHAAIRVSALARELGVTTETIRRDLDELGESGILNRTYGGAALPPAQREPAVHERQRRMVDERSRIGAAAAAMIGDGEILMVDAGSTTLHFARHLASASRSQTVLTNSLAVATTLAVNAAIRVILCPGDYSAQEGGVFGPHTAAFIRRFNADRAVIGASGLDALGPTEARSEAVGIKCAMMEGTQRRMLLVDAGKFDAVHLERICPLADLTDIVSDRAPRGPLAEAVRAAGVKLHLAPKRQGRA